MRKAFLITLVLLFSSLCFAERNRIDACEKMAEILFERGTYIVFNFQRKDGNIVERSVLNKNSISSINCYNDYIVFVYTNGNKDTCDFSNCEFSQDRNGNIIINVTLLDS